MRALVVTGRALFAGWLGLLLLLAPAAARACDAYDPVNGILTIPQVIAGNRVYLNVVVALGLADVQSVGAATANPAAANFDVFDFQTGLLAIPCVTVGAITYSNVVTGIQGVLSVGGATDLPAAPVMLLNFPLADTVVGDAYSVQLVQRIAPDSNYTIGIDTLANGSLPAATTIHFDGTLSGTPFATGATDINGWQVPHLFTFGVCATDTLSRVSTSPCPQASVLVNPTRITAGAAGNGSVSVSPAGSSCGADCHEGFALGANVTLTAMPAPGWAFAGWTGACAGNPSTCHLAASGRKAATATFTPTAAASLTGTWVGPWNWSGPASNGCPANDGGTMTLTLTQTGNSFTGSINATGFQTLDAAAGCNVVSVDPDSGTFSGTISGSSVNYSFSFPDFSLDFSGTATLSGNQFTSNSLVRATGGSGSFSLTRQ